MLNIYNEDCITGAKDKIADKSIDLIICDPPFGIEEQNFAKHYKRNNDSVLDGYVAAPVDYLQWTFDWLEQAARILTDDGSMYVVSGWSNLYEVLHAIKALNLTVINHIVWKYNFGVYTKKKFVTAHYHIFYLCKAKAKPKFNTFSRFAPQEKTENGGSALYEDLEDVFVINKEFKPNQVKNINKLPDELIRKMIQYSSDEDDTVCDFFLGNFTTATVAYGLGRNVVGFELNPKAFDYYMNKMQEMQKGEHLSSLKVVEVIQPANQGKRLSEEDRNEIYTRYLSLKGTMLKKDILKQLCEEYGRGKFSIVNILDDKENNYEQTPEVPDVCE